MEKTTPRGSLRPKKSEALIKKLSSFVSQYQGEYLKRRLYVDSRTKAKKRERFIAQKEIQENSLIPLGF